MVDLVKYILSNEFTPKQTATLLNALYDKWLKQIGGAGINSPNWVKSSDEFLTKLNSGDYEYIYSIFLTPDKWTDFKKKLIGARDSKLFEDDQDILDRLDIDHSIKHSKAFSVCVEGNGEYFDIIPANKKSLRSGDWLSIYDFVDDLDVFSEEYDDPIKAVADYLNQ